MFREAFDLLDANGDGTISRSELVGAATNYLGSGATKKRSGELDFSKFMEMMIVQMRDLDVEQELIEAFKLFDRDGNCAVSVGEVREMMERIDEVEEGQAMLREFAATEGTGDSRRLSESSELSFSQFAALMLGRGEDLALVEGDGLE